MHRSSGILILLAASMAAADEPRAADVTKRRVVERPTEELVAELTQRDELAAAPVEEAKPAAAADRTKRLVIEPAAEAIVRGSQPPEAAPSEPLVASDDNPRVEPGKVHWHKDVNAAMAAAKSSGKPVLVFHLLGNLDQRFT
jgi:hypothetical protein